MRLLVLGGTWFVGRALAEAAVAAGWEVTCFNRGRTGRDVPGVDSVRGDRTKPRDLQALARRGPWDAVVDTGAFEPPDVVAAASALEAAADRYVVVSTVSAYRDWPARPTSEGSPLWPSRPDARESDPDVAAMPGPFAYGTLKAGCETAAASIFPGRTLVLRPGVVLGPYEYVGRLAALLDRAARGGPMLVAGRPEREIQPVDVRDLAAFVLRLVENGNGGAVNVVAPIGHASYGELIYSCIAAAGGAAEAIWVAPQWLSARGVSEWTELPLWRSPDGTWAVDGSRAAELGLTCRPLSDTVADTWAWLQQESPVPHPRAAEHGLDPNREAELLAEWRAVLAAGGG